MAPARPLARHAHRALRGGSGRLVRSGRSAAAALTLALLVAACGGEDVAPFGTAEVTVEPVAQVISTPATVVSRTYPATVRAAARVAMIAPGSATIAALDVGDGAEVVAGQRLGRLRSDALTTALRQAEAGRTSALVALRAAEDSLARGSERPADDPILYGDRIEEVEAELFELRKEIVELREDDDEHGLRAALLQEQRLLSEYDTFVRQSDGVTSARSAMAQAEQALTQARRALADLALIAPVDGTVRIAADALTGGGRQLTVGSDLSPGQPVLTITTAAGFFADLRVAEADLAPVVEGARVVVDLEAFPGVAVGGTVRRVVRGVAAASSPGATAATATFVAEVELDEVAGLALRDGLSGLALLPDLSFSDRFEVRLEVDEIDVVLVEVGQQVSVELDALRGRPLAGTIVALAATPERSATGATIYRARVRLEQPAGADLPPLRGGLTGTGDIEVQRLDAPLTVPSTALRRSGGSEVVYVVRGGVAVEVPVRVLAFGDARAAIVGEVRAGERVVTIGVERIEDGDPVELG